MIISASRRTDIPAFYTDWFINRIRAGYCRVPNPFNSKQISTVSLLPEDVDAFVFWSKNPTALIPRLGELDQRGFVYYFLFTLNDYPATIEPNLPALADRMDIFKRLSDTIGPERVIWRYDPIVISSATPQDYHFRCFENICSELSGRTHRVIVSLVDYYRKTDRRLAQLESAGITFDREAARRPETRQLLMRISATASAHRMDIRSCAEPSDLGKVGIPPGGCVDAELIKRLGRRVSRKKDPGQRNDCRCIISKDIGVPDTCLHGCRYCYATRDHTVAWRRHAEHDPQSPFLWSDPKTQ